MRSTLTLRFLMLAFASALAVPAALGATVSDGHPTDGTLVSAGPASFTGALAAYAEGRSLLVLDPDLDGAWSVEGGDVDVRRLDAPDVLPRVEVGLDADRETRVVVRDERGLGLPHVEAAVDLDVEARAALDAEAATQLLLDGLPHGPAATEPPHATATRGRVLALYVLDGILHVDATSGEGRVLTEPVSVGATAAAHAAGFPVAANPGAYELRVPGAAWEARGDALAVVESDRGPLLVRVRDGIVRGVAAGDATAYAAAVRGAVDGGLALGDARGVLHVGPAAHDLTGGLLRLSGAYAFEARSAHPPDQEPDGRAEYRLQGRTVHAVLPLDETLGMPAAVFAVPAVLAALGVLVYFGEALRLAAFAPFAGLFSRIADSELLENEVRDRIHRLVAENPGITIKECMALAAVGWGTTVYHLRRLEDSRLVTSVRDGNYRRYYRNGAAPSSSQKAALGEMRREPSVRIAQFVMSNPGACQKDVCEALEMSPPLAHKYLRRLLNAKLVDSQREWKKVRYYPTASLHRAAGTASDALAPATGATSPAPSDGGLGSAALRGSSAAGGAAVDAA